MIRLVVFLGNCGKMYANNRHNVAWLFADSLAVLRNLTFLKKFKGIYATREDGGKKTFFLKPETFMNASGESAAALAVFFKIKPEEILAVHDELELPPGTVSLKWSGGLGGHNGLRSLKAQLGTGDFWRLRIGIGRPDGLKSSGQDIAGYVLSDFSAEENSKLSLLFGPLGDFFTQLLNGEPADFLDEWKKKKLIP